MTLLDAPVFDQARYRRKRLIVQCIVGVLAALFIAWWLVAGHPVDWPWHWDAYIFGERTVNRFLTAVEQDNMSKAYGIWMHDPNWQQHQSRYTLYPFSRFEHDWGPNSPDNDYGVISSHKIAAARYYGNVLLVAVLINGRKSGALNLDYDPKTGTLDFAPPGMHLYLGP
jgi:hypothetical protein